MMPRPRNEPTDLGQCPIHGTVPAAQYKAGTRFVWRCQTCQTTRRNGGDAPASLGFCNAESTHGPCRRPTGHPPDQHVSSDGHQWPASDAPNRATRATLETRKVGPSVTQLEHRPVNLPEPTVDLFSVIPDLVVDLLGGPAIVTEVHRNSDREEATLTLRNASGDHEVTASWSTGQRVTVLGIAVDGNVDNIEFWNSIS